MTKQKLGKIRDAVATLSSLSNEDWEELYGMIEEPNWIPKNPKGKAKINQKMIDKVSCLIKEIGVPANIKGYKYLQSAVIYYIKAEKSVGITTELYPVLAEEFSDTPLRVERAIRHAVQISFEKKYRKLHEKIFGDLTKYKTGKPSNGEFIANVAEYLKTN